MPWGRVYRWSVVALAIVATIFAIWAAVDGIGDPVSQWNADRIQKGMTREQVHEIMGRRADRTKKRENKSYEDWYHKKDPWRVLTVVFEDDTVFLREFGDYSANATLWSRFIRWIGW